MNFELNNIILLRRLYGCSVYYIVDCIDHVTWIGNGPGYAASEVKNLLYLSTIDCVDYAM